MKKKRIPPMYTVKHCVYKHIHTHACVYARTHARTHTPINEAVDAMLENHVDFILHLFLEETKEQRVTNKRGGERKGVGEVRCGRSEVREVVWEM